MDLLIVESPTKSKTIMKYLGKNFKVLSSYGHVRGIPSKSGAVNCKDNFEIEYEIQDKSKSHIQKIETAAKHADTIYLATDPDREGEAISWHIAEILAAKDRTVRDRIKRAKFQEITKDAVIKAIKEAQNIDLNLVQAQQARQALDYLVGFTLSPVLWRKLPGSKSAGRVQSVALRAICDREKEVKLFNPEEYWSINGEFTFNHSDTKVLGELVEYQNKKIAKLDIKNDAAATEILNTVSNKEYSVSSIKTKDIIKTPPPPFTTSTLIQSAANTLGFSAKKTAKVAQELYEGISINGELTGLITYMRTDSVAISSEAITQTREMIANHFGDKYTINSPRVFKNKTRNAQEAHEAIRPVNAYLSPTKIMHQLNDDQNKLYDLIWKRLVATQMAAAKLKNTTVEISVQTAPDSSLGIFSASGTILEFDGFYVLYGSKLSEGTQELPKLSEGDIALSALLEKKQHFTKAPPRYGEATLIKTLEKLGIGRPSTYPTIIATLKLREYVDIEQKKFVPTMKGNVVNSFLCKLFTQYVSYDFTANLEEDLDKIAEGSKKQIEVMTDFWGPFETKIAEVSNIDRARIMQEIESSLEAFYQAKSRKCTKCNDGIMTMQYGKYGVFFSCSKYPECKNIENLSDDNSDNKKDEFPKSLCMYSDKEVILHRGPYGFYLKYDDRSISIPKNLTPDMLTQEIIECLLSMPKKIGIHHDDQQDILLGSGKFGPYVLHNKVYASIKRHDFWNITEEEANNLLKQKASKSKAKTVKKKTEDSA